MPIINDVWRPHDWRDWEVDLVDASWDTVDAVQEAVSLSVKWAQYGYGGGAFSAHIESRLADDLLSSGVWYFKFYRDGVHYFDKMLSNDDRGWARNQYRSDDYIKVKLAPLELILKGHVGTGEIGSGNLASPNGPIDDGFKWIVDHVVGPNAYDGPGGSSRSISGLAVAADTSEHATSEVLDGFHDADLYEALQKYGPYYGVDWRIRLIKGAGNANTPTFETFTPARGLDKTTDNGSRMPVILNDASSEIIKATRHRSHVGFANVVIAKDKSSEVTDATSVATYGRRELIADTNDATEMQALLDERKQRVGGSVTFAESEMVEIGTEAWQIQPGDTVRFGHVGLGLSHEDAMIREVEFKLDKSGIEQPTITFGEYKKTLSEKASQAGGGGSGGSSNNGFSDPLLGLQVGSDVALYSFGDPSTVTLVAGAGIGLSVDTHQITVAVGGATAQYQALISGADPFAPAWTDLSGLAGTGLTFSGGQFNVTGAPSLLGNGTASYQVPMTGATPFAPAWTALSANVSAGGIAPLRSDSSGNIRLNALYLGTGSNYTEATGDNQIALYGRYFVSLRVGNAVVMTDGANFYDYGNVSALGKTTNRWTTVYGVEGNFSGDVTIGTTAKGLVFDINTSGKILGADGVRFRPKTPGFSGHTAGWTTTGSPNTSANPVNVQGSSNNMYLMYWLASQSFTHIRVADDSSGDNERWLAVSVSKGAIGATEHYHNMAGSSSNMGGTTGNAALALT